MGLTHVTGAVIFEKELFSAWDTDSSPVKWGQGYIALRKAGKRK